MKTEDKLKQLSWKEDLSKLTPWKIHRAAAKRKRYDKSLINQTKEEDNQSSPSRRVKERDPKKIRLQKIAERVNGMHSQLQGGDE